MSSITLITGGTRSGKSDYALAYAQEFGEEHKRFFLATCPRLDEETQQRIDQHRRERENLGFQTVEESVSLIDELSKIPERSVVLIDCITLWINNLLYEYENSQKDLSEEQIVIKAQEVVSLSQSKRFNLVCVSGEVGLGLVPVDRVSRLYRDLVGRCNRYLAEKSQRVIFVSCGCPLVLK